MSLVIHHLRGQNPTLACVARDPATELFMLPNRSSCFSQNVGGIIRVDLILSDVARGGERLDIFPGLERNLSTVYLLLSMCQCHGSFEKIGSKWVK